LQTTLNDAYQQNTFAPVLLVGAVLYSDCRSEYRPIQDHLVQLRITTRTGPAEQTPQRLYGSNAKRSWNVPNEQTNTTQQLQTFTGTVTIRFCKLYAYPYTRPTNVCSYLLNPSKHSAPHCWPLVITQVCNTAASDSNWTLVTLPCFQDERRTL
jgi:hypothetical protein